MKKWTIGSADPKAVSELCRQSDLSELCSSVLASQGCITIRQAAERIGCSALSDPFLIRDMREAADAVNAAIDDGRHICIYGDYDCDGVCATVILYTFLTEIGANVSWRIPERSEGYGLNEQAVHAMHEDGVELIVTVDNGISAVKEAKLIHELGMELVITDHHQPGSVLPEALAIVDPHREDDTAPFKRYCGAGLALLLVAALNDGDTAMAIEQAGDLAAVATIADVVSLTGENRFLVQQGLAYLENTERPGLRALREVSGLAEKELNSVNVAFSIAPRINAAGRLASPRLAVSLLTEESPSRARELADELGAINTERKACEEEILHAVRAQIDAEPDRVHDRVLVFAGEGWHPGVIGIVAARLMERWGRPCFMISIKDGIGHGSARSFGEFSVFDCLTECGDLFEKYGGHPAAGGFSIRAEQIPALRERVAAYAARKHPDMPVPELHAACVLRPEFLRLETARTIAQLEPFGCDNPEPVFLVQNAVIRDIRPLSSGIHTKLTVDVGGMRCDALLFRMAPERTGLSVNDVCHLMVTLSISSYMGQESVSLIVQDFRPAGLPQGKIIAAMQTYDRFRRGETLSTAYYQALCPTREELVAVYQTIQNTQIEALAMQMLQKDINYCKLRICLDIFAELGLIAIEDCETRARRLPVKQRADLQSSGILQALQAKAKEGSV